MGIFTDVFRFPIDHERYYKFRPIELLSGRLYWNVNNTMAYAKPIGRILAFIRGSEAIDPQFEAAFDAVDEESLPRVLSPFRMRVFTLISSWRFLYFIILGFFVPFMLLWGLLILFLFRGFHMGALDDVSELSQHQKFLAIAVWVIFFLCIPIPIG